MAGPIARGTLLLIAVAMAAPGSLAQPAPEAPPADAAVPATPPEPASETVDDEVPLVEVPGGEVVVLGRRDRAVQQATTEVVSLLSSEDIARTGEGDIAGALARVTGMSVANGGFVYVRGLGDRYSQALLNGLPLPSPEPLRRAIPLDLFPTEVIASSLVQKTYSANLPGEFGGGLINLTTLAVPKVPFFNVSAGISGDSVTTDNLGYDHYGSKRDWTGYNNGARDVPPALQALFASRQRLSDGNLDSGAIASQFVGTANGLVQTIDRMPVSYSASLAGGTSWILGESQLGLIGSAGLSNSWLTRDIIQQSPASFDLSVIDKDYRSVVSQDRIVNNALLGLAYEFGDGNRVRWTNLYIHDTLKRTSLTEGKQNTQRTGQDFTEQGTAWYEREVLNTQLNASFKLQPVSIDLRAGFSQSQREAPFELDVGYSRTNQAASPYGAYFLNRLDNGQTGFARISFSDLQEDLWSAGADVSAEIRPRTVLTAGVDFSSTQRDSTRREFQIIAPSSFPSGAAMFRPDHLLSPAVIDYYDIGMVETTESDPAFGANLRTQAAYAQIQSALFAGLEVSAGVRFEKGEQRVFPLQVFTTLTNSGASTRLDNDYLLPGATATYKFADEMQLRFNVSRTIARPQFRELMFQAYFDPESNRAYRGNPLLADSEFLNAEARYEWYFAPEQRFSLAGFYKKIDRPIEAFTGFNDNTPVTSFANAPKAMLYGAEIEAQKYFPLDGLVSAGFLASRRAVLIGNYTYTRSKLQVGAGDVVAVYGTAVQPAANFFVDGAALTGQSDHLANLQFGLENMGRLSQQTLLVSFASDRVTSRGPAGLPDIHDSPGVRVDLVAREGFSLFGQALQLKLEGRNLLRRGYSEYQQRGGNRIYYNRYDQGASFSASVSASF